MLQKQFLQLSTWLIESTSSHISDIYACAPGGATCHRHRCNSNICSCCSLSDSKTEGEIDTDESKIQFFKASSGKSTTQTAQQRRQSPLRQLRKSSERTTGHEGKFHWLAEAHKLSASWEILLWMTPSEAPKALQASECSELLDPMRASCWISAQH